jgi:hypothetical protein
MSGWAGILVWSDKGGHAEVPVLSGRRGVLQIVADGWAAHQQKVHRSLESHAANFSMTRIAIS